jgi:Na+/proline symporter
VIEQFTMRRQAARAVQDRMRIFFRIVLYLVIVAVVGLLGMAIFSDLPAPQREVEVPVEAQ